MGKFNLSDSELEIMEMIWNSDSNLTFREIMDYFNNVKGKNWIKQTLRTKMVRLVNKGFIICEKENNKIVYLSTKTKEEHLQSWIRGLLDNLFDGSMKNFMSALSGGSRLDKKTIDELKEFLKE